MFSHYLRIALRNVLKYKVQNVVSVLSIATSAMLLTVVGSLMGELRPVGILSQPYADRVVSVSIDRTEAVGENMLVSQPDAALAQRVLSHEIHSVERMMPTYAQYCVVTLCAEVDGEERSLQTKCRTVDGDMLNWWGVSSASGGNCAVIGDDEVVITMQQALQVFGTTDVIGRTVEVAWRDDATGERHRRRIVDVLRPEAYGPFNGNCMYVTNDPLSIYIVMTRCIMQLREGASREDLVRELEAAAEGEGDISVHPISYEFDYYDAERPMRDGILYFLVLFFAVSVIGYMRMQAQMFRIRQREIALRTVLGAKRWQLIALFSTEVLIILGMSMTLTLALNTLIRNYLTENLGGVFDAIYWPMDDFTSRTLVMYAVTAVLCLIVVALVIRSIRRRQTGLAMQMRPSRHGGLSVATITVQMILSTLFIGTILMMAGYMEYERTLTYIPDNDDYYSRCLMVGDIGFDGEEKERQVIDMMERSENVERVLTLELWPALVPVDTTANAYEQGCLFAFQRDNQLIEFYNLQPVITNPNANPGKRVFVSKQMMENMQRGGTWQAGHISTMHLGTYDIAGWYDKVPYQRGTSRETLIVDDAEHVIHSPRQHVIVAREGRYKAAAQDLRDAFAKVFPGNLSLEAANYRTMQAGGWIVIEMMMRLFVILAAISIITTVASLYSVISLDTRRRRKEVALRKIHGATARNITRLFATRYVVICAACYAIALPVCILAYAILDIGDSVSMSWWMVWIAMCAVNSLIVTLTITCKIRSIATLRPSEWLAKE